MKFNMYVTCLGGEKKKKYECRMFGEAFAEVQEETDVGGTTSKSVAPTTLGILPLSKDSVRIHCQKLSLQNNRHLSLDP